MGGIWSGMGGNGELT